VDGAFAGDKPRAFGYQGAVVQPTQPIQPPHGGGPGPPSPPNPFESPVEKPRGRTPMILAGCGCLAVLLACGGGAAVLAATGMLLSPGEAIATTPDTAVGAPLSVSYAQEGEQRYRAWMEVDVTGPYRLTGTLLLLENGQPFGQYTVDDDGDGSPVDGRSTTRLGWTRINDHTTGTVSLFPLPARSDGATIEVRGSLGNPGASGTVRLFVTER
jgi:hypothetical protein